VVMRMEAAGAEEEVEEQNVLEPLPFDLTCLRVLGRRGKPFRSSLLSSSSQLPLRRCYYFVILLLLLSCLNRSTSSILL